MSGIFDDLHDLDDAPMRASKTKEVEKVMCPKCSGSGRVRYGYVNIRWYECGMCKGAMFIEQARINRYNGAKKAEVTRTTNLQNRIALYREEHPKVILWLEQNIEYSTFAQSLNTSLYSYGTLTEKQTAAVYRSIEQSAERRAESEKSRAVTLDGNALKIHETLSRAVAKGLKNPGLRAHGIKFTMAKATSRNPGCVYVTADEYAGKINPDGVFIPVRDCPEDVKSQVAEISKDPLAAAVQYGKETGKCSCCGRELTDPVSISLGIGPICLDKYFGG